MLIVDCWLNLFTTVIMNFLDTGSNGDKNTFKANERSSAESMLLYLFMFCFYSNPDPKSPQWQQKFWIICSRNNVPSHLERLSMVFRWIPPPLWVFAELYCHGYRNFGFKTLFKDFLDLGYISQAPFLIITWFKP